MSEPTRTDSVTVDDGSFDLHLWVPDQGSGPGVVLIQEIFGVGEYIRAVAHRLARIGYVVAAPDLFWRTDPGWAPANDDAGMAASFEVVQKFDAEKGVGDLVASLAHLRSLPEQRGKAGALGFCLGGTLAHLLAAASDPDAIVSYYGSGVPDTVDKFADINCPALYHFGGADPFISNEKIDQVVTSIADDDHQGRLRVVVQPEAGHAFDNHTSSLHNTNAAAAAWAVTETFLIEHLALG